MAFDDENEFAITILSLNTTVHYGRENIIDLNYNSFLRDPILKIRKLRRRYLDPKIPGSFSFIMFCVENSP